MSTGKVIFTYKRKRLSSCSGVDHGDACSDFASDVQTGNQNEAKNRSEIPKNNLKIFKCINFDDADLSTNCKSGPPYNQHADSNLEHVCQGENFSSACSPPQLYKASMLKEDNHVERFDTINTRESILSSHDMDGETSGTNISAGVSLVRAINLNQKDSCLDLNSSSPLVDECLQGDVASQSAKEGVDSVQKQIYRSDFEIAKAKLTTPLRTFSRRLKRKANAVAQDTSSKLVVREGTPTIENSKSPCVCSCEATHNSSRQLEGSLDLEALSDNCNLRTVLCQEKEEVINKEIGDLPHCSAKSCTDTVILKHPKGEEGFREDLIVDASANGKQYVTKTSESTASLALNVETRNISRENVECSSNIGSAVSFVYDSCKTDDHPVSDNLMRASSGGSQLTSSDNSESKMVAGKTAEQKVSPASLDYSYPASGAFVIDCNVIPNTNLEVQASDIIHETLQKTRTVENLAQGHLNSKSQVLFQDQGVQTNDSFLVQSSKDDAITPVEMESKPCTKWLQLFPDEGKSFPFSPANANTDIACGKAEQNKYFGLDNRKDWLGLSSNHVSGFLGLSMPAEPIPGQTSKNDSGVQLSGDQIFKTKEFIKNPVSLPFADHASFILRHKILLETINTNTTAPRVNRNISLDKFEPCSTSILWSEEELDSLWIGIRRHGRGNWHAMLLDPRLRFSPWRTARELADQWEHEQRKLVSRQHRPQDRFLNRCNVGYSAGFMCPENGIMRESISTETRLSLGDVYSQNAGSHFGSNNAKSYGIAHNHVRISSCGSGPPLPPVPALPLMGAPWVGHPQAEHSGTSCGPRKFTMAGEIQPGRQSMRKRAKTNNLIIIDGNYTSSEETISDDHNVRR